MIAFPTKRVTSLLLMGNGKVYAQRAWRGGDQDALKGKLERLCGWKWRAWVSACRCRRFVLLILIYSGITNRNPITLDQTNPVIPFQDYGIWLSLILAAALDMDAVKERVLVPGKAGLKNLAGKSLAQIQRYNFYLHKNFFLYFCQ